ncbi:MAG TPA: ankyrin repeat domain-containing protein, partial [Anaerovoracaceae bacterium]|nr:ankyrin repeat domain-containing protein [Anaerovoracaceae bacterium]
MKQESQTNQELFTACYDGKSKKVLRAIRKGADVNIVGGSGWTPLHQACQFGKGNPMEVINVLLDQNANIDAQNDNGETPLHLACRNLYVDIAKTLLIRGASPNIQTFSHKHTPLHCSVKKSPKALEIIKLLYEFGTNVHHQDYEGCTALHSSCAVGEEAMEISRLLVDCGADINCQSNHGTPIFLLRHHHGNELADSL